MRKAKAQLELNLAAVVRDKQKFYKINLEFTSTLTTERAKENLHPLFFIGCGW